MSTDDVVIRLISNARYTGSHENTVSHFITELKTPFDVKGEWSVGLAEISYTKSWFDVLPFPEIIGLLVDERSETVVENTARNWQDESTSVEIIAVTAPKRSRKPRSGFIASSLVHEDYQSSSESDDEEILPENTVTPIDPRPPVEQTDQDTSSITRNEGELRTNTIEHHLTRVPSLEPPEPPREDASPSGTVSSTTAVSPRANTPSGDSLDVVTQTDDQKTPDATTIADGVTALRSMVKRVEQQPPIVSPSIDISFDEQTLNNTVSEVEFEISEPIFDSVPDYVVQEMLHTLGKIITYTGNDSQVQSLVQQFQTQMTLIYQRKYTDQATVDKDFRLLEKTANTARESLLKNLVDGFISLDMSDQRLALYSLDESKKIHQGLTEFLERVVQHRRLREKVADLFLEILTTHTHTDDSRRWVLLIEKIYSDEPLLRGYSLSKDGNVLYYILDDHQRAFSFITHYKDQLETNLAPPSDAKKAQIGRELLFNITKRRDSMQPLVFTTLRSVALKLQKINTRRKRETSNKRKRHTDAQVPRLAPGVYSVSELVEKINNALRIATDIKQRKLQQRFLTESETDLQKLPRLRRPPVLTHDPLGDIVKEEPGQLVVFKSKDDFGRDKHVVKTYARLSTFLRGLLGLRSPNPAAIKEGISPTRAGIHSLLVYTDIVKHTLVGNTVAQLLRFVEIPTRSRFGDQITIRYDKPQFYPLNHNYFKTVEIQIFDDSGYQVPFTFGRTYLTLVFKRVESQLFI